MFVVLIVGPFLLIIAMVMVVVVAGKGAVFGYDAVGSFKRDDYGAMGSGQTTVMPILDNLVHTFFSSFFDVVSQYAGVVFALILDWTQKSL